MKKLLLAVVSLATLMGSALAQTLTVTSPNDNDFLGRNNRLRFTIRSLSSQARVVVTTVNVARPTIKFSTEGLFDPNVSNEVNDSLSLNFDAATPTGKYTISVEMFVQGTSRSTTTISNVEIDTRNPRFKNVAPANNAFVNRIVPIRADLDEPNPKLWRVSVNDRDIPNNSGEDTRIRVSWDTEQIEFDGSQSISLRAEDRAQNVATRSINVTLDRVASTTTVLSPGNVNYRPGATIPVSIQVVDQFSGSVNALGVTVELRTLDGRYLGRVSRLSVRGTDNGLLWTGRIRLGSNLPKQFKLVTRVTDRAGNVAQNQEVVVTIGR